MVEADQGSVTTKAGARNALRAALEAEVSARTARWAAIGQARSGMTVREIAAEVAKSGLAGQEVVRVHLAAARLAQRASALLAAVEYDSFLEVVLEGKRGEPGRYTGVRLAEGRSTGREDDDYEAHVRWCLSVLHAGGIVPAIPPDQVSDVLRSGGGVWLTAATD